MAIDERIVELIGEVGDKDSVRIDRQTKWGNPFRLSDGYSRTESILRFGVWLETQPQLVEALPELKGRRLGCWCAPRRCHGEVLALVANGHLTVGEMAARCRAQLRKIGAAD